MSVSQPDGVRHLLNEPPPGQEKFAPVPINAGPANEIIAMLAVAMLHDGGMADDADEPIPASWHPAKTITALLVGCSLFWLLSFLALGSLI